MMKKISKLLRAAVIAALCFGVFAACDGDDDELVEEETEQTTPDGDETTGDETTGDETTGDETTGDETTGDETTGDETTGDETDGDETTGDETTGDETTGDEEGGEETTGPYLTADPTTVYSAAAGTTATIAINSNVAWTITELDGVSDWFTINPASGEGDATVTVTVAENTDVYNRSAYPTISSYSIEEGITLTIYQDAAAGSSVGSGAYFTVEEGYIVSVPAKGSSMVDDYADVEFFVTVNSSSISPAATCDNSAFTIVSYGPLQNVLTGAWECYYGVAADANTSAEEITGTITLTYEDQTETISIVQEAPETSTVVYVDASIYFGVGTTFDGEESGKGWEIFYAKDADEGQVGSALVDFGVDGTYSQLKYEVRSSLSKEYTFKMQQGAKIKFYTNPDAANTIVFKKIELVAHSEMTDGCCISADKGSCSYDNQYYETISSKMCYFQTWEASDSNTTEVTITATQTYNNYYAFRFTFDILDSDGNVINQATYTTGYKHTT